jgi:hypothetical protein
MWGAYAWAESFWAEARDSSGDVEFFLNLCDAESFSLMPELTSLSGMDERLSNSLMPSRTSDQHCED